MEKYYTIGFMCERLVGAIEKAFSQLLINAGSDLTPTQFVVLRCLYYNDHQSQLSIANLLSRDAAGIKRNIDKLEEKGLAKRIVVASNKNEVAITELGKEKFMELDKLACLLVDQALTGVTPHQRDITLKVLDKAFQNINNNK